MYYSSFLRATSYKRYVMGLIPICTKKIIDTARAWLYTRVGFFTVKLVLPYVITLRTPAAALGPLRSRAAAGACTRV